MRSFILKTMLAAAVVSTSIAGAYAASGNDPAASVRTAAPMADPAPEMAGKHAAAPAMIKHAAAPAVIKASYRPRLATIVHELGAANRQIKADHANGHLTRIEFRKLRNEERGIRHEAFTTASRHEGRLPRIAYNSLRSQVRELNRNIHTYARA